MNTRKVLAWLGTLLLTLALTAWFLKSIDIRAVVSDLKGASPRWLAAAVAGEILFLLLRALRWKIILRKVGKAPILSLVKATVVSYAISGLLPGRLGEIARPVLLSRWQSLPLAPVLATSVLERGMDLVALVLLWLVFVASGDLGTPPSGGDTLHFLNHLTFWVIAIALPTGAALFWIARKGHKFEDLIAKEKEGRHPLVAKVLEFVSKFADGLAGAFQRKRDVASVTALSVLSWGILGLSSWAVLEGLHQDLPLEAGILVLVAVCFGSAIPTPAGVGGVHKSVHFVLVTFYSMETSLAGAAGILVHLVLFLPGILGGLVYAALGKIHFSALEEELEQVKHPKAVT